MRQFDEIRILIILKRRHNYDDILHSSIGLSTGLYNSAKYIENMLITENIESKLVVVVDNNDIDREVTLFKPTHVIIEALWVVPEKFIVLHKLHPDVKWIVRLHSQLPFIAMEGISMKWIAEYAKIQNVIIAVNSIEMLHDIRMYIKTILYNENYEEMEKVIYLPNYYPKTFKIKNNYNCESDEYINISCFGAIRPLKNHLIQAFAALKFATNIRKKLIFHINGNRIEQKSEHILTNIISLFSNLSEQGHELVLHDWLDKDDFLELCSKMDIGLQCSMSETFNIVCADLISQGVPVIGSPEIPWLYPLFTADPTNSEIICKKLLNAFWSPKFNVRQNQKSLNKYSNKSKDIWIKYFLEERC